MNSSDGSLQPDFEMKWCSNTDCFEEKVHCTPSKGALVNLKPSKLRDEVATLKTDCTYVEVSEVCFLSPVSFAFMPNRPGFSLFNSATPAMKISYGYSKEPQLQARLENVVFMLPGKEISGNCSAGTFRAVTCSFDPAYAEAVLGPLRDITPDQLERAQDIKSPFITCTLMRLMNEAIFPGPASTIILDALGQALLAECRHWMLARESKEIIKGQLTARHFEIIEGYVSSLVGKSPSVLELANICGFSERYLARLFRQRFGCSISSYLKSTQINRAKFYLSETNLPLKEIAHRLGFRSQPSFATAFRAAAGVTPGQFRQGVLIV